MIDQIVLSYLYSHSLQKNSMRNFLRSIQRLKMGMNLRSVEFLQLDPVTSRFLLSDYNRLWRHWEYEIKKGLDCGICYTFPGQEDYPGSFYSLEDLPYFLSYLGKPAWQKHCCLAVVGSREPSLQSVQWLEETLAHVLKTLPLVLASGGARGVDQIVHRVCLRQESPTLVFLPSGLHQVYPKGLLPLMDLIPQVGGALVSEYLPSTVMKKHLFHQRNRLISGVSIASLIVDCARKSGTLLTAKKTITQNRPVFVIPSHPLDHNNLGALDLLMDGATPVRDALDLIMLVNSEINNLNTTDTHLVNKEEGHH